MGYLSCLHCTKPFANPSNRRYCSVLCKSAVEKQMAKQRLADDRHHDQTRRQPTFDLTDIECLAIEARLAGNEFQDLDYHGFQVKDGHKEQASANANELHESWATKGADLDIWEIRRKDRARFGGIAWTPEINQMYESWLDEQRSAHHTYWLTTGDLLASPDFHNGISITDLNSREIPAIVHNVKQLPNRSRKEIFGALNLARDSYLRRTYGITLVDYQRMLDSQHGGCFGCGKTVQEEGIWLAVDHNHETSEVRGVLCRACNVTLGFARDTPATLRKLADYLERLDKVA
jgi:hypothetical protein